MTALRTDPPAPPPLPDDATLRRVLADATVPALLPAIAQITGRHDLLREDLRPDPDNILEPDGGLGPEQLAEARELALSALRDLREGRLAPAGPPDGQELSHLMAFLVGDDNVARYFGLLREELAVDDGDPRAPTWHLSELAPGRTLHVAIIGAGMSGIAAAHRLRQAGIGVTVFEKNEDVGGTWLENTYPGARVDVPNHLYSYSFASRAWPEHFSAQDVLLDYFRGCADELGIRPLVRFGTEVRRAAFDEDRGVWELRVRTRDGSEETHEAHAVISAVGQLNRPHLPEIEGRDSFAGPAFHSARWDHDVDLRGARVAVIGTGASAAQFIPAIADEVAELRIFQRTPNWLVPTPEYHDRVPHGARWLVEHLPHYAAWYRLWLFWRTHEGLLPMARVDPTWQPADRSVSAGNDLVRELLAGYLREQFADEPDLLDAVVPRYPPIAKRVIRDNGVWARTLKLPHVHLVTDGIDRITEKGVVAGGEEHPADVIIYGTGFHASKFLTPMEVRGRGGADLHETWEGDARAYLGVTIPGFPNLFCLYGPNTNIVINGSIIYFSECGVHYILDCLRHVLEHDARALDCRPEVHDRFNEQVDEANRSMAWGASEVNSWYKNAKGRVSQNWPFSLLEYWERTRRCDPDDYELL